VSEFQRPAWLEQALAQRPSAPFRMTHADAGENPNPAVGQIRVIRHLERDVSVDRLGLIVEVEEETAVVRFLLLSPFSEYRAAADYLLEPADSGSSMRLIVECDLRGAVRYPRQLGACVGACDPDLAAALDAVGGEALPEDVGLAFARFGLPARDESDPRWAWKLSEFDDLERIVHKCEEWLLGDESEPVMFDPAFLRRLAESPVIKDAVVARLISLANGGATMAGDPDSLESLQLLMNKAKDPTLRSALIGLQNRELARMSRGAPSTRGGIRVGGTMIQGDSSRRALASTAVRLAGEAHAGASVLTDQDVWPVQPSGALSPAEAILDEWSVQLDAVEFFSSQ